MKRVAHSILLLACFPFFAEADPVTVVGEPLEALPITVNNGETAYLNFDLSSDLIKPAFDSVTIEIQYAAGSGAIYVLSLFGGPNGSGTSYGSYVYPTNQPSVLPFDGATAPIDISDILDGVFSIGISQPSTFFGPVTVVSATAQATTEVTITDLLSDLSSQIFSINLQAGISNALDAKLNSVLNALDDSNANNDGAALNSMYAFCSSVEAQRSKKLTDSQADSLIAAANRVIRSLDEFAPPCQ